MDELVPGLIGEAATVVTETDTAGHWGSGSVPVFGTPALVGLMEGAAVQALAGHLPPGRTSVGGRIDVHHLAPTPVGMRAHARAELLEAEGRRLVFHLEAWDEVEQIGRATHERFIVDEERFVGQAKAKIEAAPS
jgi:fluoroacetyl-CoA thioesterase